jgi:hypothetical protein
VILAPLLALLASSSEKLPRPFTDAAVDTWIAEEHLELDPRYRRRFFEARAAGVAEGKLADVVQEIVEGLRGRPWALHPDAKKKVLAKFEAFAGAFRGAYAAATSDGVLDTPEEQGALLSSLNAAGWGREAFLPSVIGPEANPVVAYFVSESDPDAALVPYKNLSTDAREEYELLLSRDEMIDFRLRADAVTELLDVQIRLVRGENVASLRQAVERWENYLDKGYSQYPWESLFNGAVLDIPELGPPDRQWIVLHPALGIEVSTRELDEMQVKEALDLEVIGYLKYRGAKYEDFWGGSLTVSLRDDVGPGFGVLAHVSRSFNIGLSWHDFDRDGAYFDDSPCVFCSLDVFRFVSSTGSKLRDRYESTVRDFKRATAP